MTCKPNIEMGKLKLKEFVKKGHFGLDNEVFPHYFWKRFQSLPGANLTDLRFE